MSDRQSRQMKRERLVKNQKYSTSFPALAAAAMAGSLFTAVLMTSGFARSTISSDSFRQLGHFGEIFTQVHDNYVVEPDTKDLIEGAIDGMLNSLDPHSSYLDMDDFQAMTEQTRGTFAGLGIQVSMDNEGPGKGLVRVIAPIDDTPAQRAGILTNDFIYEIDGTNVFGMTLNDAISIMKGERGTSVTVKILREGAEDPIEVTLVRDIVTVNPVTSRVESDNFGYVRLSQFTEQTYPKMLEAIRELEEEIPGGMRGLVLDVRTNPGGLLDQAVSVSDAFLEGGEIVSTRGRRAKDTVRELGTPGDLLNGRPIVVLINGGSASASEIVAGALQDRNRALLLGTKSFGKGSVQTVLPLQNGINGALRLTTARYYTPSGRSIQAVGIVPDIVMPIRRADQEDTPERRSESDLEGALAAEVSDSTEVNDDGEAEAKDTSLLVEEIICPEGEDCQLNRAIELLQNNTQYKDLLADARLIER